MLDSFGDRAKDARPTDFVELRFIKELEDSGSKRCINKAPLSLEPIRESRIGSITRTTPVRILTILKTSD